MSYNRQFLCARRKKMPPPTGSTVATVLEWLKKDSSRTLGVSLGSTVIKEPGTKITKERKILSVELKTLSFPPPPKTACHPYYSEVPRADLNTRAPPPIQSPNRRRQLGYQLHFRKEPTNIYCSASTSTLHSCPGPSWVPFCITSSRT